MSELEGFRDRERIRLVESDLQLTNEFIRGVIGTGTAVRGVAVTIWLALVGFAIQQQMASFSVLACLVALAFWLLDGYYGWLYTEGAIHARACETLLSEYYNAISRGDDNPRVVDRLRTNMRLQTFGLFLNFRSGYGLKQWWAARPVILYRTLYIAMFGLALAYSALLWFNVVNGREDVQQPEHIERHHDRR